MEVTGRYGAITSSNVTLTVNTAVQITGGPDSITNGALTAATFAVTLSGGGPYTYQWKKNGLDLADGGTH